MNITRLTHLGLPIRKKKYWKTVRDTLVTGTHRIRNQVRESNSGSMALYTKVIGMKIKPMAEADLSMPMVTFTTEIGRTIKPMALELITTLMVPVRG